MPRCAHNSRMPRTDQYKTKRNKAGSAAEGKQRAVVEAHLQRGAHGSVQGGGARKRRRQHLQQVLHTRPARLQGYVMVVRQRREGVLSVGHHHHLQAAPRACGCRFRKNKTKRGTKNELGVVTCKLQMYWKAAEQW